MVIRQKGGVVFKSVITSTLFDRPSGKRPLSGNERRLRPPANRPNFDLKPVNKDLPRRVVLRGIRRSQALYTEAQ